MPMSIGMGLTFVPITLLGTSGVTHDDAGLASGLFNTAQQVGGSLGLAILSTLAATPDEQPDPRADARRRRDRGAVSGYHVAFAAAAVMLAAGAVILVGGPAPAPPRGLELAPADLSLRRSPLDAGAAAALVALESAVA